MNDLRKHRVTYGVILLSAFSFILIYGYQILNVTYTEWLLCGGDLSQHYLGWKFFRNAPWQWYIGMMNNIAYPYSESIIFTDSIPLFAVIFKSLSGILPESFQYFGIWGLLCFILQGYFASMILRKFLRGNLLCDIQVILGSLFFVLAPILLRRMYWHTSLGAQWLILLSLMCFVYHDEWFDSIETMVWVWAAIGVLGASIHIYFLPMCGVVLLGFLAVDFMRNHNWGRILATLIFYLAGAVVTIWLLGGFFSGMDDGAPGLGYYSFNLDGFVSPQEWSALFEDIKNYADGQYEGFAYLGFGVLILLCVAVVAGIAFIIWGENSKLALRQHKNIFVCILMGFLSIAIAASHEVSFGSRLLFKLPILHGIEELWAVFRASGRLVWPAVYMLMIIIICGACRGIAYWIGKCPKLGKIKLNPQIAVLFVLGICLCFQIYDLNEQLRLKHQEFAPRQEYQSELKSSFWEKVLSEREISHLVFADKDHMNQEQLYSFAEYASEHDMTINDFYFARALTYPIEAVADDFMKHPKENTLYIFTEEAREQSKAYELYYYEEDGFIIGVTDAFSFAQPHAGGNE